ncbi:tRNA (5-methylaminomethyl-2-thiouridine)(34)-methyltransferase MnmD [Aliterella atlantica]|uniref:MnmC-like methyltransferase domain-containing protein n=1 Tax=Aliterella atlantica CENA595 TaxID=1618023 RepID=A0A0D8ZW23_9CYAN|nr:MnmC family methyltransferase [Aliterella atlantica]KJH72592.1 hypothetical protein UH38_05570 [Aliterella atlantica CENA595]
MSDRFIPQLTADGSATFYSDEFGETFHSHFGARQEAELKFVAPTKLDKQALAPQVRLLDVCYGLGYNTAAALAKIWAINPHCRVEIVALEANANVPQSAIARDLLSAWGEPTKQILTQLATKHQVQTDLAQATLLIGDARATIKLIQPDWKAEAIFLDPFSPPNCPQLWTVEFIQLVANCLSSNGILATYSSAAAVRTALVAAGLHISSTVALGRRSPGTIAANYPLPQLSVLEQERLLTRAAIPYRDPSLNDLASVILQRRRDEQQTSQLETTSHWRKRIQFTKTLTFPQIVDY